MWQPIKTAPTDGTMILLYDKYFREQRFARFVGSYSKGWESWVSNPGAYGKKPTHWTPLLDLPEAD